MRTSILLFAWIIGAPLPAQSQQPGNQENEEAIRSVIRGLDDAWNRGDGEGWADSYTEDGEFINILGTVFDGRRAIEEHHSEILSTTFKGSEVDSHIRRLQWLGPDVAVVDTDFHVRNYARLPRRLPRIWPDGSMRHRLKHIMWKREGQWLIIATQNTPMMPPVPR